MLQNKSSPTKKNLKPVTSYKEISQIDSPTAPTEHEMRPQSAPASTRPATEKPTKARQATDEQISQRAYEIWNERGRPSGQEVEHWLEAERELLGYNRSKR